MMQGNNVSTLPANLPVPVDDGACDHLLNAPVAPVPLLATSGRTVNLAAIPGRAVVYCYPRTGQPNQALPQGWDTIPGARGCTPEACSFRDHYRELQTLQTQVFGLSTQDTAYQREAVERLQLPFELLSDDQLRFTTAMRLPTFTIEGMTLIKRLTLIIINGVITHVFYPVFPPDQHATEVIRWLQQYDEAQALGQP